MSGKWTTDRMPDLTGKVAIVTGANSGLGFESTRALAQAGATVVMACRSRQRGETARIAILEEQPNALLDLMTVDNASLDSVRAFATAYRARYDRLHILLNNAGIMAVPRTESEDGFELQFGVNHLAHFALTGLLMELLVGTPGARVHNVSSSANFTGNINFDDLMGEQSYSRYGAYGQSKLANVLFTNELQRRLVAAGYETIANSSHPGLVMSNLQSTTVEHSGSKVEGLIYRLVGPLMAQDATEGVLPQLYGATAEEARGGVFYGPKWLLRGRPVATRAKDEAYDEAMGRRLWEISEKLTGVSYLPDGEPVPRQGQEQATA